MSSLDPRLDVWGIVRVALGVVALLTVLLTAFAWPTSELEPRSLPLAVAAPSAKAASAVESQLEAALGEAGVDVIEVDDRDAAVRAIEDREVYGAFVVGPGAEDAELLIASAASPMVAQRLDQAAQRAAAASESSAPWSPTWLRPPPATLGARSSQRVRCRWPWVGSWSARCRRPCWAVPATG
ncbi:hypothetical protein [Nocardioides sp. TF02-7]|uniref:hypothetical protein n=1 Tax=Nocardioides sp. TF02-7 TaxID=2917724 RepID=UPI001F06F371|nr:hypothetical protein [Nocardioides sp. TF02-7]UMG94121.1 hypothetical protein MF408_08830 [Nocardioides sp. TF02-7]